MGKNYDAYAKAEKASQAAQERLAVVNGGATEQATREAITNAAQAQMIVDEAWQNFLQDPQG